MRFLDLFSGIGNFTRGLEWAGMECIGQVENDDWCNGWLEYFWPDVPRWGDARTYQGQRGSADLVCGGPPCQPASCAGRRRGTDDDRWLWPAALRVVAQIRPRWCLFENPTGVLTVKHGLAIESVFADLESQGYEVWPVVIPACAVGAPHRRDRVWIVAHADRTAQRPDGGAVREEGGDHAGRCGPNGAMANASCERRQQEPCGPHGNEGTNERGTTKGMYVAAGDGQGAMADTTSEGRRPKRGTGKEVSQPGEKQRSSRRNGSSPLGDTPSDGRGEVPAGAPGQGGHDTEPSDWGGYWHDAEPILCADGKARLVKPGIRCLAHGVPGRVPALRALGNAVVPQVVKALGRAMMEADNG